ncbi:OmpA family protein [Novosphingobium tardum]|jgi:outer membrane protein OmpA-like peptidoglycan-associated protein|uniref:OmpA family protein n=1 Tax=Novosphingobium tardum TaxID=1538021 RepID=A0ABV8RJ98_9SPHN
MSKNSIFAAALLLAGSALAAPVALAQSAPADEQTSQDLVCQLSGQCPTEAPVDEAAPGPGDTAAPAVKSGARISATRGFKIARHADPAPAAAVVAATPAPAKARIAGQPTKRPIASTAPGRKPAPAPVIRTMAPGRADLRVSFLTGSAELSEPGQREAIKFVEALKSPLLKGMRFSIEGHTDAVGTRESNLDLSKRRAQAVVDYLVGKGADRARFDVRGYGFDRPLEGTSAASAANRRVEVVRIK